MKPVDWLRDDATAIFLFHGVVESYDEPVRNYGRKHLLREEFESVIHALVSTGCAVSMDDIVDASVRGYRLPSRAFAVTFDDGFANNLTVAAPVLRAHSVPATFYLTTRFVDENRMSWIDRIERAVQNTSRDRLPLPWRNDQPALNGTASRMAALEEIRAYVKYDRTIDAERLADEMTMHLGDPDITGDGPLDRKLTWDEVAELVQDDLFTIGGHSHTHRILSFLDTPALHEEIDTCLSMLRERLGQTIHHFSYPEGLEHCVDGRVIEALHERDVACAPMAERGVNPVGADRFRLRRINVTGV